MVLNFFLFYVQDQGIKPFSLCNLLFWICRIYMDCCYCSYKQET